MPQRKVPNYNMDYMYVYIYIYVCLFVSSVCNRLRHFLTFLFFTAASLIKLIHSLILVHVTTQRAHDVRTTLKFILAQHNDLISNKYHCSIVVCLVGRHSGVYSTFTKGRKVQKTGSNIMNIDPQTV